MFGAAFETFLAQPSIHVNTFSRRQQPDVRLVRCQLTQHLGHPLAVEPPHDDDDDSGQDHDAHDGQRHSQHESY